MGDDLTPVRHVDARAQWVDEEAVVDGDLDIPAFNRQMIALFGRRRGGQAAQAAAE